MFNPKWYASYEELSQVIAFIDKYKIGGGVNQKSIRAIWNGEFTGPFLPLNQPADRLIWVFATNNGVDGACAGLVLDTIRKYPENVAAQILTDQFRA